MLKPVTTKTCVICRGGYKSDTRNHRSTTCCDRCAATQYRDTQKKRRRKFAPAHYAIKESQDPIEIKTNVLGKVAFLTRWPKGVDPRKVELRLYRNVWRLFVWGHPLDKRRRKKWASKGQFFSYRFRDNPENE